MQLDLISLGTGLVWILPFSHWHILWLMYICHAAGLWPMLKLNLTYWQAETDDQLLLAACVWIKIIICKVLLSWAALPHLLQLCLSPLCIAAEIFWISIFPTWHLSLLEMIWNYSMEEKSLIEVKSHSEVTYFNKTVSVAVFHNYKIALSSLLYFYWQSIFCKYRRY